VTIIESRPMTESGSAKPRTVGGMQADWAGQGRCLSNDPDALFVRGAAQQNAKVVCQKCPVIAECLADALDNRTEFGVWGGMTERERRALLKRNPHITSWRALFQQARLQDAETETA
jgi:WhiB family transcriptional regulator, redox-sensing transcriptional regulator